MELIAHLAELLLSWPACALWLALLFRADIGELLRRLRSVRCPGYFEGRLDPRSPARRWRRRTPS